MNRRTFLKATGLSAASIVLPTTILAGQEQNDQILSQADTRIESGGEEVVRRAADVATGMRPEHAGRYFGHVRREHRNAPAHQSTLERYKILLDAKRRGIRLPRIPVECSATGNGAGLYDAIAGGPGSEVK